MIVILVIAILVAFFVSLGVNRLLVSHGGRLGLLDQPGERRIHTSPVPRAGGVGIWIAFVLTASGVWWLKPEVFGKFGYEWLGPFMIASVLLVGVGVIDDSRGLKAWWKLLGQIVAVLVFFLLRPDSHGQMIGMEVPAGIDAVAFVAWSVLLINAFNLIDGLDGLCAGLALIALVALGAMAAVNGQAGVAGLIFVMAAAVGGFLRYNWNPAKIFLGDAGSMLLGFFIAASATQTVGRRAVVGAILLPIAVAGVPLLDVILAVWRRSFRSIVNQWTGKEAVGVFSPDKDHLHHRFLDSPEGQRKVARLLHALAVVIAALAFLPVIFGNKVIGITVVGFLILALFGLRNFARIELVQSGSVLHFAAKRPIGSRKVRATIFLYDCLVLVIGGFAAVWLESASFMEGFSPLGGIRFVVVFVVIAMISLFAAKAYRRAWSRANLRDFVTLWLAVTAGGVITVTIFWLAHGDVSFSIARIGVMAVSFTVALLALPRCAVELMRELAVDAAHRRFGKKEGAQRHVVVYGCGDLGNLFIEYLKTCPPDGFNNFRVVGFIDRESAFKGKVIRGFPVLGDLSVLGDISSAHSLHGIIVAISRPDTMEVARLKEIAVRENLAIYSWCFDLTPAEMKPEKPMDVVTETIGDEFPIPDVVPAAAGNGSWQILPPRITQVMSRVEGSTAI